VTAYVRNPAKVPATLDAAVTLTSELDDAAAVARAVQGADAVVNASNYPEHGGER
jgi:putative NADH-flavin reductase